MIQRQVTPGENGLSTRQGDQPRLVAMYLPQYHPIPENDEWWGPGFTEWRNVAKARPLFSGHYQPHIPGDLGFYDLRLAETRAAQAQLAAAHGIHGFCYYHYWFTGKRLLHRPLDEVFASGEPDFPFCLCWANENWTRAWDGRSHKTLIAQDYSEQDDLSHIRYLLPILCDPRYIRVSGRPLLLIYRASLFPDIRRTLDTWRQEADRLGAGELFFGRVESFHEERNDPTPLGFDAAIDFQPDWQRLHQAPRMTDMPAVLRKLGLRVSAMERNRVYDYASVVKLMLSRPSVPYRRLPCVVPSWDNSPRRRKHAVIFHGSDPALYEQWLAAEIERAVPEPDGDRPIIFINAWNEWAEGNHLEPDERFGRGYLEATARALGGAAAAAAVNRVGNAQAQ